MVSAAASEPLRLGEAVRPEQLPAQQVRQQCALRVGAELGKRVAGQGVHADCLGDREPPAGQDLQHLEVDLVRLGGAAVLLVVRQAQQPGPTEGAQHLPGELGAFLEVGGPRRELAVGEFGGEVEQVVGLVGGEDPVDSHSAMSSRGG